jgi:hypothetical protein
VIVSSLIPFPNIGWWALALNTQSICFDIAEHFEKMSYRNKCFISGANGVIQLSIPLQKGREQRTTMNEVLIDNNQRWQTQHWRSIVSAYKRTPYFDHYEPALQPLFEMPFERLTDFNRTSIEWLKQQLKCKFDEIYATEYVKKYPQDILDIRHSLKPGIERTLAQTASYYQVFSDKNGFAPNLSMLDLLFAEGPHAMNWINENREIIRKWSNK